MVATFLTVLLVAALGVVGAQQPTCSGVAYDPAFYVCPAGKLCPASAPCSCPDSTPIGYGCFTVANRANCASGATCAGSSNGDPLVKGFDGCAWYLKGKPDTVMNLVSEANHVVNTRLVPANLTDEHHGSGEGTFHGSIAMRYKNAIVTANVTPEGNLTVFLGDKLVPFEEVREQSGLTVKVTEFYSWYGQVAEVVTPAFRFFIHAVQPYNTSAGWNRGHLDFSTTITATDVAMHGLLGQTINSAGALCPDDFEFHGEGAETDYVMPRLDSVDFAYSAFVGQKAARRLQATESTYMPTTLTKTAYSHGFL